MASTAYHITTTALLILTFSMAGCRSSESLEQMPPFRYLFGPNANPNVAGNYRVLSYPDNAYGDDLDIIVKRQGFQVSFTNRTANNYSGTLIWLNQQYVTVVKRFEVGQTLRISVADFVNKHGEPFPVGGLLTPDRTYALVLAELYDPIGEPKADDILPTSDDTDDSDGDTPEAAPAKPKTIGSMHRLLVRTLDD